MNPLNAFGVEQVLTMAKANLAGADFPHVFLKPEWRESGDPFRHQRADGIAIRSPLMRLFEGSSEWLTTPILASPAAASGKDWQANAGSLGSWLG
jgi:hypothetical protein